MVRLRKECALNRAAQAVKPRVVISGAGIAGLMRAIIALRNGNFVQVIEKRAQASEGRSNPSLMDREAAKILKECGVFQYLDDKMLLGESPSKHFLASVGIASIEKAMKAVIEAIAPGEEIVLYQADLKCIIKENNAANLVIRVQGKAERVLKEIDLLVVAEGTKSATSTLLSCRKIEAISEIPVIGAIFKEKADSERRGFVFDCKGSVVGIVLHSPGYCSIGCTPLASNEKRVKEVAGRSQKERIELHRELTERAFTVNRARGQTIPLLQDLQSITTTTMSSGFQLPFCGTLHGRSIFMLAGDALTYVDVISGSGANNAIQSAQDILPVLKGSVKAGAFLKEHSSRVAERIGAQMNELKELRDQLAVSYDARVYNRALYQLQRYKCVERVQRVVGVTLTSMLFESVWGEKCVRAIEQGANEVKYRVLALCHKVRHFFGNFMTSSKK